MEVLKINVPVLKLSFNLVALLSSCFLILKVPYVIENKEIPYLRSHVVVT